MWLHARACKVAARILHARCHQPLSGAARQHRTQASLGPSLAWRVLPAVCASNPCPCTQAIRLDPKAPLPHLGTAQAYLASGGDPTNAVSELELVLRALPGNGDALRLLGGLLPVLPERVAKTLAGHREAAARQVSAACERSGAGLHGAAC